MIDNPILSIITVTKNCVYSIEKTFNSVKMVKNERIEYIVIDGVSTDGTLKLITAYASLIDVFVSEADTGIYNAMNKGIKHATGDYVLFMNGDDEILEEGFADVLGALESSKAPIVCAKTIVGEISQPSEKLIAEPWKLLFFNSIPHPSSFVSKALLERYPFREDLNIASDYDFFLQAYLAKVKFYIISKPTALHGRGGMSGDKEKSFAEILRIRKERLGWRLPYINRIHESYRMLKFIKMMLRV